MTCVAGEGTLLKGGRGSTCNAEEDWCDTLGDGQCGVIDEGPFVLDLTLAGSCERSLCTCGRKGFGWNI